MVLLEAVVRLLPGVVGSASSLDEESFESGLLEYPQYTRPREWEGASIPDVLLSGDHKKIARVAAHRSRAFDARASAGSLARAHQERKLSSALRNPLTAHSRHIHTLFISPARSLTIGAIQGPRP